MKKWSGLAAILATLAALGACAPVARRPAVPVQPAPVVLPAPVAPPAGDFGGDASSTARAFVAVLDRMEPAVERQCIARRRSPINCDFQFVVVDDPTLEINAFQDRDRAGRPIIGFTLALIAAAHNADELAFVVGHEASHHILEHMNMKAASAARGAEIFGVLASASGGDARTVRVAQRAGAQYGARYFSKEWELEADYLGTIITAAAGYDPRHGAEFFRRIPDPGDRVLGSHPSNAARIARVDKALFDMARGVVR